MLCSALVESALVDNAVSADHDAELSAAKAAVDEDAIARQASIATKWRDDLRMLVKSF